MRRALLLPSELVRFGSSIRPHGELLFLLMQKKPVVVPDSEAFNSCIGDGFLVPESKDECEASEDEQADNVSNEASYVIGLRGSGDKISRCLQDWEVGKVALSCHRALDMLCQELYEVERRRGWFEPVCLSLSFFVQGKEACVSFAECEAESFSMC